MEIWRLVDPQIAFIIPQSSVLPTVTAADSDMKKVGNSYLQVCIRLIQKLKVLPVSAVVETSGR